MFFCRSKWRSPQEQEEEKAEKHRQKLRPGRSTPMRTAEKNLQQLLDENPHNHSMCFGKTWGPLMAGKEVYADDILPAQTDMEPENDAIKQDISFSRWWFQIYVLFSPLPGETIQFD